MSATGWLPVVVPGQVAGWEALAPLGRLGLAAALEPAIRLATDGFAVQPITAAAWQRAEARFDAFPEWRRVFGLRAWFRNPDLAASLAAVARDGAAVFYEGRLADAIVAHATATGGLLRHEDLAAHRARWEAPLSVRYRSIEVVGLGAPTQGIVTLEALALLDGLGDDGDHDRIEAIKLAFADAYTVIAEGADAHALLDPAFLDVRRRAIDRRVAGPSPAPPGLDGGTVLVCAADEEGRLVSLIQSNFHGFGSGIVVPGTGIALNNRGLGFSLREGHPNAVGGGKRPFHTILPGLLLRDSDGAAFGCMGGQMQPQGQVQLAAALARGASPTEAVSAPRWRWLDDGALLLEEGFDPAAAAELAARGHRVRHGPATEFGGAQVATSRLEVGTDPRKDGARRVRVDRA
jgi:gamma-glutamyltranspeptidase/glutathione hydrolase